MRVLVRAVLAISTILSAWGCKANNQTSSKTLEDDPAAAPAAEDSTAQPAAGAAQASATGPWLDGLTANDVVPDYGNYTILDEGQEADPQDPSKLVKRADSYYFQCIFRSAVDCSYLRPGAGDTEERIKKLQGDGRYQRVNGWVYLNTKALTDQTPGPNRSTQLQTKLVPTTRSGLAEFQDCLQKCSAPNNPSPCTDACRAPIGAQCQQLVAANLAEIKQGLEAKCQSYFDANRKDLGL